MRLSLDGLYPDDTFNLITFAGDTDILFEKPVPATRENLEKAQAFLAGRQGAGGTEMMKAIKAALEPSDAHDHLRIVCFMTDGEVGNDDEIIAEVQKHPRARVFSFGIGESVNRSLLDQIAKEGNGEAEYVALEDDGSKAAKRFYERVRSPLLTDLSIDWNGMPVSDIYPNKLSDLFSAKPVILHGRYGKAANGSIKLRGNIAGQPYERDIAINLPESEPANDVLATLWARTRIDDISSQSLKASNSEITDAFDAQITNIGLEFRLLTQFTSFVAVEDRVVNQNGKPVTIQVPVILPEGMNPATTIDANDEETGSRGFSAEYGGSTGGVVDGRSPSKVTIVTRSGTGQGSGYGSGGASGTGSGNGAPPPPSATVNVMANASEIVDTTSSQINSTVNAQAVQNLPINGRSFSTLLTLNPGITPQARSGQFQIDGASGTENTFIVDGTEVGSKTMGLGGQALLVVRPAYPAPAKARKALGQVDVEFKTDTWGNVISANAVSGNPLLRKAAERAAMLTRFAPVKVEGTAVRLGGTIAYNFKSARRVEVSLKNIKAAPPSAEDKRMIALSEKMHFWLSDLLQRLQNGTTKPGMNENKFVHDGKADIQIELSSRSPEVIEKLKAAGFEVVSEKGKTMLIGKIALDNLAALAEIDEVKLILPKI